MQARARRGEERRARRRAPALGRVAAPRVPALVFTPDRLAVVKGGPAARRAYFDRVSSGVSSRRAQASPQDYAAALAQRNAALRRVQLGLVEPRRARAVDAARLRARRDARRGAPRRHWRRSRRGSRSAAGELGLLGSTLAYDGRAADRRRRSKRASTPTSPAAATGLGPHLDDVRIAAAGRDLRSFGSQGEQRLALLALLLAEAELLARDAAAAPRRRALGARRAPPRACSPTAIGGAGAGRDHGDAALGAAGRAGAGRGGDPWTGCLTRSAASSRRFGAAGRPRRARRALAGGRRRRRSRATPGRRGSPATAPCTSHTADSVWAFELGHRAAEIAARLGVPKVRFAPGPLPSRRPRPPASGAARRRPSEHDAAGGRRSPAEIDDENLRESVQKAVSLGLARHASDRPV